MTTSACSKTRESPRPARLLLAAAVLWVAAGSAVAAGNDADARAPRDKQALIHELVRLTDAAQVRAVFSRRLIDRVAGAVALFSPAGNARTLRIVREETEAVVRERIDSGDALYSVLYPVYEKHFNIFELNQLVTFYQSPLGQKLVRVSPQLLTESLSLGREWGLSLVPEIADRVQARLADDDQSER